MLKEEEKRAILRITREAILPGVPDQSPAPTGPTEGLLQQTGVFVTVRLAGKLRGCVGLVETDIPLMKAVGSVARKAAFEDPRFPPMTPQELQGAEFEISILSDVRPLETIEDIRIGQHGLLVDSGVRHGLLLPEVALEYGWTREEFVNAVLNKAGLPPAAVGDTEIRFCTFLTERITDDQRELA